MRVELITFRFSATLGGFDDSALVDFTRDKEVIAFREDFHSVNEMPHLSCVVHYQDAVVPQTVLEPSRLVPQRPIATERQGERNFRRRDGAPDPCEAPLEGRLDAAGNVVWSFTDRERFPAGLAAAWIVEDDHIPNRPNSDG